MQVVDEALSGRKSKFWEAQMKQGYQNEASLSLRVPQLIDFGNHTQMGFRRGHTKLFVA